MKNPQTKFIKDLPKAYGGDLLNKRKARQGPRPLVTKHTMHLTMRSTQAVGEWSFARTENRKKISQIISKFSNKYGVKVLSMANVGNHLHFQIKLSNRYTYKKFIRAISSAIVMAVTKVSRKKKLSKHFWNYRPFTRVIASFSEFLNLKDYIRINQLEGYGWARATAINIVKNYSG